MFLFKIYVCRKDIYRTTKQVLRPTASTIFSSRESIEGPLLSLIEGPLLSLIEGPLLSLIESPLLSLMGHCGLCSLYGRSRSRMVMYIMATLYYGHTVLWSVTIVGHR